MKTILIVDDDKLLLHGYALACKTEFAVDTAQSGTEAIARFESGSEYAVVVTDMNMPAMTGTELLAQIRSRWPDTVRVMLTGNRAQDVAVRAVNQGNVFRFLDKPCPLQSMLSAVKDAVRQYELIVAEKELLEKTLNGSIQILAELLGVADPAQLVRSQKLRDSAATIAKQLKWENVWEIEFAAMLRQIGTMTIPPEVVLKGRRGQSLSNVDQEMLLRVPEIGSTLLSRIPRLEGVARIIHYQAKHFDGSGYPRDSVADTNIPAGARLIMILSDYFSLESKGGSRVSVLAELAARTGRYDPMLLQTVREHFLAQSAGVAPGVPVALKQLRVGQTLAENIVTRDGIILVATGYAVTETLLERLENFAASIGVYEPVFVRPSTPGK